MGQTNFTKIMKKQLGDFILQKQFLTILSVLWMSFAVSTIHAQCLTLSKSILGVVPASSGIAGNIDITYEFVVSNTGCATANNIYLTDQMSAVTNLGNKFVRVIGTPSVVYTSAAPAIAPSINNAYNGTTVINLTSGGFLELNDSTVIRVTVELNLRNTNGTLNDTAHANQSVPATHFATSNVATIPDCWTNCQLACNNSVQVSVNTLCEAEIVAEMILEGEVKVCADLGFYKITLMHNDTIVNMPINKLYIGKTLRVNVKNIVCLNSCWGTLLIEDKTPPALICLPRRDTLRCSATLNPIVSNVLTDSLRFPIPPSAIIDLSAYPYKVYGLDACGVVNLTFSDSIVKYGCANPILSSTVYRKWRAVDPGGFSHFCTDTFDLRKGTLLDVTLPPHYDDLSGAGHLPKLECNGSWTKLANGFPDTSATGTGSPRGTYCGNIQFDYSDDTTALCPGTFVLFRRWLILDWCTGAKIDYIQRISVKDKTAPLVICPSNKTISTTPWNCGAAIDVPKPVAFTTTPPNDGLAPYVRESCSGFTYRIEHLIPSVPGNCTGTGTILGPGIVTRLLDGSYRVENLVTGCNWIKYYITDGCGNQTTCTYDIFVEDKTPPVAVCHQRVIISVGSNGFATMPAKVMDNGSHDNCGQAVSFRIARMVPANCGTTVFGPTQTFCCQDVSRSPIAVILEVTDASGNTSLCMDSVTVQDKLAPEVKCPANVTVTCEDDLTNLSRFGTPVASDNCSTILRYAERPELNSCGLGNIYRDFTYTDPSGLTASCTQTITVVDNNPFTGTDIIWPANMTLNGCLNNTSEAVTGKPSFLNKDKCNQPVARYDDLVFNYVENVCYKILRNWTVIDWCRYDPSAAVPVGIWYHTQVIKITNTEPPTFTSTCHDTTFCITENCSASVTLQASATDLCTPQSELRWSYAIDLGNNGTVDVTGNTNRVTRTYGISTNKITWRVEDQCGNFTTCSYLFEVKDCKKPTPYCNTGIITVLMENTKSVTIWAKDYDLGSSDNCTGTADLKYSFSRDIRDISKTFTCADIDNGISDTVEVEVYVTDAAGNFDLCKTKIILQDNRNVCPDRFVNNNTSHIAGTIVLGNQSMAAEVPVSIYESAGSELSKQNTNLSGKYEFALMENTKDYLVKPNYDGDPLKGVSTRDILKIQKHILGLEEFKEQYQFIAADVNNSKSITAKDISDIRKLILGVTSNFVGNNSWNFVSTATPFDINNPFAYTNQVNINALSHDMMDNNFMAVKTGDVTGEANTNGALQSTSRNATQVNLLVTEQRFESGDIVSVPISFNEDLNQFNGIQMALTYDESSLEFVSIEGAAVNIEATNYNLVYDHTSTIRISYSSENSKVINANSAIFILNFKAKTKGKLDPQSLFINEKSITPQVYSQNDDLNLNVQYIGKSINDVAADKYVLYQNIPNPFSTITNIQFFAPKNDEIVELSIHDISGKILFRKSITTKKGINELEVKLDPGIHGILYYKLDAKEFNATRKMVVIR